MFYWGNIYHLIVCLNNPLLRSVTVTVIASLNKSAILGYPVI